MRGLGALGRRAARYSEHCLGEAAVLRLVLPASQRPAPTMAAAAAALARRALASVRAPCWPTTPVKRPSRWEGAGLRPRRPPAPQDMRAAWQRPRLTLACHPTPPSRPPSSHPRRYIAARAAPGPPAPGTAAAPPPPPEHAPVTGPLYAYLLAHTREPSALTELRAATAAWQPARARNAASPDTARLLAWLVGALGVRRALEVGVFTGYSATAVALVRGGRPWHV